VRYGHSLFYWRKTLTVEVDQLLSDPRLTKQYYFQTTPFRQAVTAILRATFRLFSRLEVKGIEHFPKAGPVIAAANHLTNFDVFPIQFALNRPIFYMGKEELFRNPLLDWMLRQLGSFPVYRGEGDRWAIRHAQEVLRRNQVLGIFPEGQRSKGGGLRSAKNGTAHLARHAACPLVPVAVQGTQHIFSKLSERTQISITFGRPLYPEPRETPQDLTNRLMFALAELLPPELCGVYARF
jgi:1-acyl-sn-glycerol-3-phosphate acyltransferase